MTVKIITKGSVDGKANFVIDKFSEAARSLDELYDKKVNFVFEMDFSKVGGWEISGFGKFNDTENIKEAAFVLQRRLETSSAEGAVLNNDYLRIHEKLKGRGTPDIINRAGVLSLEEYGGKIIKIEASMEDGAYVWLRKGFYPDDPARLKNIVHNAARLGTLSNAQGDFFLKLNNKQLRAFVLTDDFKSYREAFKNQSWEGSADISDIKTRASMLGEHLTSTGSRLSTMNANQEMFDAYIRHQTFILRSSKGISKRANSLLSKSDKEISKIIKAFGTDREGLVGPSDWVRMRRMQAEIAVLRRKAWKDVDGFLNDEAILLVKSEPVFIASIQQTVSPVVLDTVLPPVEVMNTIVKSRPFQGKVLKDWSANMASADITRMRNQIQLGMNAGESMQSIARRIFGIVGGAGDDGVVALSRRNIEAITRTAVQHVANEAHRELNLANQELFDDELYSATLDGVTTAVCKANDGQRFNVGVGPQPPLHWNACLPNSQITTNRGLINIEDICIGDLVLTHMRRWRKVTNVMSKQYDGNVSTLINNFGSRISLTNEHPILTKAKGWIEAGEIKTGDVFFNNAEKFTGLAKRGFCSEVDQAILINSHNIVTKLTNSLIAHNIALPSTDMPSTIQLQDGIPKNKVGIESQDSFLSSIFCSNAIHYVGKNLFVFSGIASVSLSKCISSFFSMCNIVHRIIYNHITRVQSSQLDTSFDIVESPVFGSTRMYKMTSANAIQYGCLPALSPDPSPFAVLTNDIIGKPILSFEKPEALTHLPVPYPDKFFNIDQWYSSTCISSAGYHYSGKVYDLSVDEDETYVADSFLIHNCRSIRVPFFDGIQLGLRPSKAVTKNMLIRKYARENDLGIVASRKNLPRGHKGPFDEFSRKEIRRIAGPVDARESYQTFLPKQSKEFRVDTLGVTKEKLFTDGNLPLTRFVAADGSELTIAQIAGRDSAAFVAAGLDPAEFL